MHILWNIVFIVVFAGLIICIPIQFRVLNRIAFGRSMFISGMAILTGLFIGLYPSVAATVVSLFLVLLGMVFMVFMSVKSVQHMRHVRNKQRDA
jgi:hypothetical protein